MGRRLKRGEMDRRIAENREITKNGRKREDEK